MKKKNLFVVGLLFAAVVLLAGLPGISFAADLGGIDDMTPFYMAMYNLTAVYVALTGFVLLSVAFGLYRRAMRSGHYGHF